jgi:hypothetical protein
MNRLVTRGLGGGQGSGLVLVGMTQVARVIRGGGTVAKKLYKNILEDFIIAAKLIEVNGKELIRPIFNKRKYTIDESITHKVNISNFKIKKKEEQNKISIFAKIKSINRGSDGKN